jgi:hypothetical protein
VNWIEVVGILALLLVLGALIWTAYRETAAGSSPAPHASSETGERAGERGNTRY